MKALNLPSGCCSWACSSFQQADTAACLQSVSVSVSVAASVFVSESESESESGAVSGSVSVSGGWCCPIRALCIQVLRQRQHPDLYCLLFHPGFCGFRLRFRRLQHPCLHQLHRQSCGYLIQYLLVKSVILYL